MNDEEAVLGRIVRWAEARASVRAVILTSTRARPGAAVDALSDYDVILYATDPASFLSGRSGTADLGPVLVQMPPAGHAWDYPTRLVLYEDGTKIDFTILDLAALRGATEALPDELDAGYRVLLDKDGVAAALPAPTGSAYVLKPPTQADFTAVVEEFWFETSYVAKNLWRRELLPAKYSLECVMKQELLRRMLEWRVALDHGWTYRPGVEGRRLWEHLAPQLWSELERTYAGAELEENWTALFRTTALFRRAATDVARQLGLEYPHHLDAQMTRWLERIQTGGISEDPRLIGR